MKWLQLNCKSDVKVATLEKTLINKQVTCLINNELVISIQRAGRCSPHWADIKLSTRKN